ncbi:MAG: F0F1 ATP synthase subunit B' [Helicobacteraceae bacterium]|nr:F0F1 ATP synthase subunit B' [Helicobacteraceae bacterium]
MLDIEPMLLGSTLIVFLILIAVANSWLYNPLLKYMADRDADIKKDLDAVNTGDEKITQLEADAQRIINNAKLEASALRDSVIASAKELVDGKIEAKKAEMAEVYVGFKKSLNSEEDGLNKTLLAQVPVFEDAVKVKLSQI